LSCFVVVLSHFWKFKSDNIASNCFKLIIWFKSDKIGSNQIKSDPVGSNCFKLEQIRLKLIQIGSNWIKLDQVRSNWSQLLKNGSNWVKLVQSVLNEIYFDQTDQTGSDQINKNKLVQIRWNWTKLDLMRLILIKLDHKRPNWIK